jgi:hypothetical protein
MPRCQMALTAYTATNHPIKPTMGDTVAPLRPSIESTDRSGHRRPTTLSESATFSGRETRTAPITATVTVVSPLAIRSVPSEAHSIDSPYR